MANTVYRVTWWPTEDAPDRMVINTERRTQDVVITPMYETTFGDIPKIIAVSRSGRPSDAQYVHVFAAVQIEGAM